MSIRTSSLSVSLRPALSVGSLVLCAAAVLALSPAVQADVISQTQNYAFPLSPGSANLSFAQFDDQGGTRVLRSVELFLSALERARVTAENDSTIAGHMGINLTGFVTASGLGLSVAVPLSQSGGPVAVAASDGVSKSGADFHDFGLLTATGTDSDAETANLLPFIGAGSITLAVQGAGGFSVSGVTDSTLQVTDFGALGDARVVYTYDVVPEPATLTLLGLGACAVLWRRRVRTA